MKFNQRGITAWYVHTLLQDHDIRRRIYIHTNTKGLWDHEIYKANTNTWCLKKNIKMQRQSSETQLALVWFLIYFSCVKKRSGTPPSPPPPPQKRRSHKTGRVFVYKCCITWYNSLSNKPRSLTSTNITLVSTHKKERKKRKENRSKMSHK